MLKLGQYACCVSHTTNMSHVMVHLSAIYTCTCTCTYNYTLGLHTIDQQYNPDPILTVLYLPQIPTGTTEEKRTTVPFMYNMELDDSDQGLDVVDFPGVDDEDDTIPDLADLLLTITQIVIFVVDYRYPI